MPTVIDGQLGVSKIQDNTVSSPKIVSNSVNYDDLVAEITARLGSAGSISGDRNRVINGSCQIVNVASLAVPNGVQGYGGPEMFFTINSGAGGQFTQSQGSMVWEGVTLPTVRQTVNTPLTSLSGSNYWHGVVHRIEGFNAFDLLGKPITLSFLFNTNLTGTYSVSVRDAAAAKSYVTVFSAVANTPTRVSISLPAIPLSASLPNSSATGISISVGAQNNEAFFTGILDNWQNGNFLSGGGTTWGVTAGNFIELTNLQLEEGTVATPFIRRSYQQELALTQRYFESSGIAGLVFSGNVTSGSAYYSSGKYKVTKRAVPTVVVTVDAALSFPNTPSTVLNSTIEGFRSNSTANATGVGEKAESFTANARL